MQSKNILLTGPPGCGKTTVIEKVLELLPEVSWGGFYTREIRGRRGRVGFSIRSLEGKEGILAHVDIKSRRRVGKYGVNVKDLEEVGVGAIEEALRKDQVLVMDELGKMELYSPLFPEAVRKALGSTLPVLATIQIRKNEFLDEIRNRKDVELVKVTKENRECLPLEIAAKLKKLREK